MEDTRVHIVMVIACTIVCRPNFRASPFKFPHFLGPLIVSLFLLHGQVPSRCLFYVIAIHVAFILPNEEKVHELL